MGTDKILSDNAYDKDTDIIGTEEWRLKKNKRQNDLEIKRIKKEGVKHEKT